MEKSEEQPQVQDLVGELLVGHLQDHIRKLPEEKQVLDQEEETSDDSVDIFIKSILPGYLLFYKIIYCFHN